MTKVVKAGSEQVEQLCVRRIERFSSQSQTTAVVYKAEHMETNSRETLQADFDAFDISEELGFLLEEPLVSFIVTFSFLIQASPV